MSDQLKYQIVTDPDSEMLAGTITTYLNEGWKLVGGPMWGSEDGYNVFAQAIICKQATTEKKTDRGE